MTTHTVQTPRAAGHALVEALLAQGIDAEGILTRVTLCAVREAARQ